MNYVKYNRSFIMMEEQSVHYAERDSVPVKGYLKVETGNNKGALRCVVQNLRYFEKGDYIYKLILFGKKGERTIHTVIGNLLVNKQGNGETYFRFLPLDMDGKGNPYHYFTTAIVAAASTRDDREPLHPVLKGATFSEVEPFQSELFRADEEIEGGQNEEFDDIIGKIDKIVGEMEEMLQEETSGELTAEETVSEILQAGPSEEFLESEMEDIIPQNKEAFFRDDAAAAGEKGARRREAAPEPGRQAPAPGQQAAPAPPEEEAVTKRTYNNFYNEYILNACAHTCRVAEFYEDVTPFARDRTGAKWKKIVNITNLPLVSPGAHYFATQYRHYIFGAKPDERGIATRFFFGIPGRFLDEEQPDGGKSGFTYWQPIRGADAVFENYRKGEHTSRNAYGYWIVAVDGRTGNIEEV